MAVVLDAHGVAVVAQYHGLSRLRDDVSGDWFVEARRQEVQHDLVTEHCYVRDMQTARQMQKATIESIGVGCIIYFQFATAHGLYDGFTSRNPAVHLWFDDFGAHFLVVSAFVYIIIMCTVLVGTAIPAWRICRSEITKSLREE